MPYKYRLGLDIGTNSIGWCIVELDDEGRPCGTPDAGVRILTPNEEAGRDPQSKQSLAANRRAARSARKRRDRFLRRQKRLMSVLIGAGLMPEDEAARKALERLHPLWLRAAALYKRLELHELGRAIFHLNQRRGFLSNRITDSDDADGGAMKDGMRQLKEKLQAQGARTLGEFLAKGNQRDREGYLIDEHGKRIGKAHGNRVNHPLDTGVRFRPRTEGSKTLYDLYPTRQMVEEELDDIWHKQAHYHEILTDGLLARLKRIIISQRPLKKPLVGKCTFRPEEERAPRALPLFQRFRILMELANLQIDRPGRRSRKLDLQQRDALANLLSCKATAVKFEAMRKKLGLPDDATFNLEAGKRKGLDVDNTAAILGKGGKSESFGKDWRSLPLRRQTEIVERLLTEPDEDALVTWLQDNCGLSEAAAVAASGARLPQGHAHLGRSMLADLVDVFENESREEADKETGELYQRPLTYDEAVERLGLHHSDLGAGRYSRLPYYGKAMERHVISRPDAPEGSQERIGRVPNPTVHIALNQIRAVVNALIDAYGKPHEIVLELARELKQSRKQKDDAIKRNRENEKENQIIADKLADMRLADTGGNRLMMRLYRQLPAEDRLCVYSGVVINCDMIANSEVDVDHILPKSQTLDDSFANKVLCTRQANRFKGNRPPADAWSGDELAEIQERAKRLFPHKAWRFAPDAMEKFEDRGGFIARHLTDTQHMARLTKDYLGHLYGEDRNSRVWAIPGGLTALLRGHWGLNALLRSHNIHGDDEKPQKKYRDDHRHHAIDGFVVACTDRRMLKSVADASKEAERLDLARWAEKGRFPLPFEGYYEALRTCLDAMTISHKPDHGVSPAHRGNVHVTSGKLHEETAYGAVDEEIDGKRFNLVTRKPVDELTAKEIGQVRDAGLRERLEEVAYKVKRDNQDLPKAQLDKKLAEALEQFGKKHGIRRVRVLKTERYTRTVRHGPNRQFGKLYVPGDNHRIEIFETPDGKWHGEGVSVFDANQAAFEPGWKKDHPQAKLKLRLHKGDLFEGDFGEGRKIYVVRQLSPANGRIEFVSDKWAGKTDHTTLMRAAFSKLKVAGARAVRVDPIGRVSYPDDG